MTAHRVPAQFQLDSFRKILKLEESKGFQDTSVIGGLDNFLRLRSSEIIALSDDRDFSQLASITYRLLTPSQRHEWVGRWLAQLEETGTMAKTPEARNDVLRSRDHSDILGFSANAGTAAIAPGEDLLRAADPAPREVTATATEKGPSTGAASAGVTLESHVDRLMGVDTKLSARLRRLGVSTIRDLLYLFPRRHNDFSKIAKISDLIPGEEQTVVATVWEARETSLGRGKLKATEAVVSDETGNINVIWFGQRYLARLLKPNVRIAISGRVNIYKSQMQFQSPEFELLDTRESLIHTGRLVPVYPLTEGLTPKKLRNIVWLALEQWGPRVEEFLPGEVRDRVRLHCLNKAMSQAHYPDNFPSLEEARKRLAFDEFFVLQMAVLMRRKAWQEAVIGIPVEADKNVLRSFLNSLPFKLTGAQQRCMEEVLEDMKRGTPPMNRLLQGEVGSGKTVVALSALLAAVAGGHQGSIMVPTEVLAEQHFATLFRLLAGVSRPVQEENLFTFNLDPIPKPVTIGLLTGSTRASLKRELRKRAREGTLDILIGTHALIQGDVEVPRLALAVVDEQHRFGVLQRAAMRHKGIASPHVLVMSATPIPRTLALTLYGDLDISTIDQLPPGRQPVHTRDVPPERRSATYSFVRKEVLNGRQAFFICPLIEESEAVEARAAKEEYERLSTEVFQDLRLGLLHGRMASRDKENVMRRFRDGEIDILVSTAVVEVGIDVPNATVMVIDGAHRFGLSQLHQFRGRVGRGEHKSYCLLLSDYSTPESRERLSAVERIHDGFQLAEVDLSQRGPGDFFGTRQSGLPSLRVARLSDQELLGVARKEATVLLEGDPELQKPAHVPLAREVSRYLDLVRDEVS